MAAQTHFADTGGGKAATFFEFYIVKIINLPLLFSVVSIYIISSFCLPKNEVNEENLKKSD